MADIAAPRIGPYGAILDIAKTMVAGDTLEGTLRAIVENVGRAMFAEAASIGSFYPDRDEYVFEAGWREDGLRADERAAVGRVYPLNENPALKKQLQTRELSECHIDDPGLSEEDRSYMNEWSVKTTLESPLVYGRSVIGLLGVEESRFVRRYTPSERGMFLQLCDLAAIGIHTARQARLLTETQRKLDRALMSQKAGAAGVV